MEDRVRQTMKDAGVSISVTTLTTAVAFALGAISNIPAVRWLCLYAMVTIIIDFFYQISFFMALLVLDAKRIQDYLYDQRVEVPIKCITGKLYVRISNHVYNGFEDMERLGQVLQI